SLATKPQAHSLLWIPSARIAWSPLRRSGARGYPAGLADCRIGALASSTEDLHHQKRNHARASNCEHRVSIGPCFELVRRVYLRGLALLLHQRDKRFPQGIDRASRCRYTRRRESRHVRLRALTVEGPCKGVRHCGHVFAEDTDSAAPSEHP